MPARGKFVFWMLLSRILPISLTTHTDTTRPLPFWRLVSKYRKISPEDLVIHKVGTVYGDDEGAAHLACC